MIKISRRFKDKIFYNERVNILSNTDIQIKVNSNINNLPKTLIIFITISKKISYFGKLIFSNNTKKNFLTIYIHLMHL